MRGVRGYPPDRGRAHPFPPHARRILRARSLQCPHGPDIRPRQRAGSGRRRGYAALNTGGLLESLRIIDMDLRRYFEVAAPRILVSGLNPHAGEGGYLGHEDIEVIAPAVSGAREAGMDARGPYPADTLFTPRMLDGADCVLAMYHDQGLPTLKYAAFGKSVNITLGLPIVRTSVDHGTALDLAG